MKRRRNPAEMMILDMVPDYIEGLREGVAESARGGKQALSELRGKQYRRAAATAIRTGARSTVMQTRAAIRAAGKLLPVRKNGPTLDRPHYPFAEKEEHYATYTNDQLAYALADAKQAFEQEEQLARAGYPLAQFGWYADDVHTIAAEIRRRKTRKNPSRKGRKR